MLFQTTCSCGETHDLPIDGTTVTFACGKTVRYDDGHGRWEWTLPSTLAPSSIRIVAHPAQPDSPSE